MNKSQNVKLVIFDMDGLLVDSEKVYKRAWIAAAERLGETIPPGVADRLAGYGLIATSQMLIDYGISPEKVYKMREMRETYIHEETNAKRVEAKPYAREVLERLKANHYLLGLASSSPKERATAILKNLGLLGRIDFLIFGDEVKEQKPSPEPYLRLLKMSNLTKEQAIIVEDSLTGIAAAKNAEMSVIQIPDKSSESAKKDDTGYAMRIGKDLRVVLDSLDIEL